MSRGSKVARIINAYSGEVFIFKLLHILPNCDIYTGLEGMLLVIWGKFTMLTVPFITELLNIYYYQL